MSVNLKVREKEILRYLYEENATSVTELGKKLNVSVVTIRSDLEKLENKGFAVKIKGGIQPVYNRSFFDRVNSKPEEKHQIAKKASEQISDGDRIIILAGTTTSLIGKFLYDKKDVHIVTNSTYLLNYLRGNSNIKVTLVGGEFLPDAEAMVGAVALKALETFHVKKCFIGTDGFSLENGVTANHLEVAEVAKKVVESSESIFLVADSSKFNNRGFAFIQSLDRVTAIITDNKFPQKEINAFRKDKLNVIIA
jgi:DeoR/GlpR family transcriptional regulator of sugar metabolism